MSDAVDRIGELQAQYDALEREGAAKFGTKARLLLEKQLRDETKKKLDALGGDRDAFKRRKSEVFQQLHAAKSERRAEIEAGVASGEIAPEAAAAEIIALGWESGVAQAAIAMALKQTADHVTTAVELPSTDEPPTEPAPHEAVETVAVTPEAPEPIAAADPHVEIMDPVGAAQPVSREEVYAEPGRRDENVRSNRRRGK